MPIPLVPVVIGAGIGALILAGKADKAAAKPATTTNATPTQQSTAGAGGGATAPSHSDSTKQPTTDAASNPSETPTDGGASGGAIVGTAGYIGGAITGIKESLGANLSSTSGTGQEFSNDPWGDAANESTATSGGKTATSVSPATDFSGLTTRFIGDTFKTTSDFFGQIW